MKYFIISTFLNNMSAISNNKWLINKNPTDKTFGLFGRQIWNKAWNFEHFINPMKNPYV